MPIRFRLHSNDGEVALTPGNWLVGRSPAAGIHINHPLVSRRHATLEVDRECVRLVDLGSRNGCYINGSRVQVPTDLRIHDRVTFGGVDFVFAARSVSDDNFYLAEETPLPVRQVREQMARAVREPVAMDSWDESTGIHQARSGDYDWKANPAGTLPYMSTAEAQLRAAPPMEQSTAHVFPVILAVDDLGWAQAIETAAAIHGNLGFARVRPTDAILQRPRGETAVLVLDVESAGVDVTGTLRAWQGSLDAPRVVLISSSETDAQGTARAKALGLQGFMRRGKPAILCVAQIRFHLQAAARG